jgi:hypothetical protein
MAASKIVRVATFVVVMCTAGLAATTAQAQSFRCKNDLANVGEAKAAVFQKCGEPVFKDSFCKPANYLRSPAMAGAANVVVVACETVDEWTYNPGYGQFMTTLRFESGRLESIRYGDRVK